MTVNTDMQRRYKYRVSITTHHDNVTHSDVLADEFTSSDKRGDPVTRQNGKLGQISLVSPFTSSEITLRLALRITDSAANANAVLIDALQNLNFHDADTCDVLVVTLSNVAGAEQNAYQQSFSNCRLTGYKFDVLDKKGDDDMLHIEISLMPSRTGFIAGQQML